VLYDRWQQADDEIRELRDRLRPARLAFRIDRRREELAELDSRLRRGRDRAFERRRSELAGLAAVTRARSPFAPLARGYALVDHDGYPVRAAVALAPGDQVTVRFGSGRARMRVEKVCDDEDI